MRKVGSRLFLSALVLIAVRTGAPAEIELQHLFTISRLPGGGSFTAPQAVYYDTVRRELIVADTGGGRMVIFDGNGVYRGQVRHPDGEPVGVAAARNGTIYAASAQSASVAIINVRGRKIGDVGEGVWQRPEYGRMALDSDGRLYITARAPGAVSVFDASGKLVRKIEGGLESLADVAAGPDGKVYILCSLGTAVHVFDAGGRRLLSFGQHDIGRENFAFPSAIDVDGDGRIWVSDAFAHVIKVFDGQGKLLAVLEGFYYPADMAIDSKEGRLFVLEKSLHRLLAFRIVDAKAGG